MSWKYESLSVEKRTTPTSANDSIFPSIKWYRNSNFYLVFKGSCLKQTNKKSPTPNFYFYC